MSRRLESGSLLILLIVVGLRPLIGESYDSSGSAFQSAGVPLIDPAPVRTLLIDLAVLLAAAGWLASRAFGAGWRYRWSGIELGVVAIACAGVISCGFAGNKRLAINATIDWLTLPVLAIVLAQLLRRRWHVRLALCVILAGAAANAAECFYQVVCSFEETERDYYERREEVWARQGVRLDSPQVEMFERRLAAREATGYTWHSNVAGAYLVLTSFAAAALAVGKWAGPPMRFRRLFAAATAVVALGLLAGAVLTRSGGALGAAGIGAGLAVAFHCLGRRIRRRRRLVLGIGWMCAIAGGAAVIGHGVYHGSLPGASLNFRWQYWCASARLIAENAATGVGMENFGRRYLQYKSIVSPEEIKNPHNFLVSAAADWGLLGLGGMVAMLIGGSMVLAKPSPHDTANDAPPRRVQGGAGAVERPGRLVPWLVLLAIGVFVPRLFLMGNVFHYLVWMTVFPLLFWGPAFVLGFLETDEATYYRNDRLPHLPMVLNCGLIAFLFSELVNFALLVPATATTFFALLGVAVAVRSQPERVEHSSVSGRWIPLVAAVLVIAVVVAVCIRPVATATAKLADARRGLAVASDRSLTDQPTYRAFLEAAGADPSDPTPLAECARYAVAYAEFAGGFEAALTEAVRLLEVAIDRDPYDIRLHRDKRAFLAALAETTGDPYDSARASEAARRVLDLYPTSPDDFEVLGDCYAAQGVTGEPSAQAERSRAIDAFEEALRLDASRSACEVIRRFAPARRAAIERKIESLRRQLDQWPEPGQSAAEAVEDPA
ncbi:MAG: O-antigen ligase family protein [Phycisphaerales bacterium]|nr:MAG: O-antigen ligase family protein [Phycisphaerales bacterium]